MSEPVTPPAAPTREAFFALYWDHARELSRTTMCLLAKFSKEYSIGLSASSWDEMDEGDRVKVRRAIMEMLEAHEHNRRVDKKKRDALKPQQILAKGDGSPVLQSGDRPPQGGSPHSAVSVEGHDQGTKQCMPEPVAPSGVSLEYGDASGPTDKISEALSYDR